MEEVRSVVLAASVLLVVSPPPFSLPSVSIFIRYSCLPEPNTKKNL